MLHIRPLYLYTKVGLVGWNGPAASSSLGAEGLQFPLLLPI